MYFIMSAGKGQEFVEVADRMVNTIKELGPSMTGIELKTYAARNNNDCCRIKTDQGTA